jgi:hypothetical protein
MGWRDLHRIDSPDDESEAADGTEEVADPATLRHSSIVAVQHKLPDDYKIGNAGDGVPSPFLYRLLGVEGGEETGEDHDDINDNSDKYVGTRNSSQ